MTVLNYAGFMEAVISVTSKGAALGRMGWTKFLKYVHKIKYNNYTTLCADISFP